MKPDILKRFTAELRSGKHRQITRYFDDGNGGSCLMGLLGKMYAADRGIELLKSSVRVVGASPHISHLIRSNNSDFLNWSGLESYSSMEAYINLNNAGVPFDTLATILEERLATTYTPNEPAPISTASLEQYAQAAAAKEVQFV